MTASPSHHVVRAFPSSPSARQPDTFAVIATVAADVPSHVTLHIGDEVIRRNAALELIERYIARPVGFVLPPMPSYDDIVRRFELTAREPIGMPPVVELDPPTIAVRGPSSTSIAAGALGYGLGALAGVGGMATMLYFGISPLVPAAPWAERNFAAGVCLIVLSPVGFVIAAVTVGGAVASIILNTR